MPLKSQILFCKLIVWELLICLTLYPFQLCSPRLVWWIPTKRGAYGWFARISCQTVEEYCQVNGIRSCSGGVRVSGSHLKPVIFSPQLPKLRAECGCLSLPSRPGFFACGLACCNSCKCRLLSNFITCANLPFKYKCFKPSMQF